MKRNVAFLLSIRTRLIAAFLLTLLPLVLLGVLSSGTARSSVTRISTQNTVQAMDLSANYVNLLFKSIEATSSQIAGHIPDAAEDPSAFLQEIADKSDMVAEIAIISSTEPIVATSGYQSGTVSLDQIRKDPIISKGLKLNGSIAWAGLHPALDSAAGIKSIHYALSAARIIKKNEAGEPTSILVMDIRPEAIAELLKNSRTGTTGETHLISPDGKDIFLTSSGTITIESSKSPLTSQAFFKKIKNGTALKGSTDVTYSSKKQLLVYSRVGTSNYLMISLIPDAELTSAAGSIAMTTLVLTLAAILICFSLGLLVSVSLVREINQMLKLATAAAAGDLTVHIQTSRKDELGILAARLGEMVANMRRLISQTAGMVGTVDASVVRVSDSAGSISTASSEITAAMQQVSSCLALQTRDLEEAFSDILGLADRISHVAENADSMEELSAASSLQISAGLQSVDLLSKTSGETGLKTNQVIQDINLLNRHSKSIEKVVHTIASIADQTKLLALNASIEAAHAGSNGLGFSVIAQEIRNLSEDALTSTGEVKRIVADIQKNILNTVKDADEIAQSMKLQEQALDTVMDSFHSISRHMGGFSNKSMEIRMILKEMDAQKDTAITSLRDLSAKTQEAAASSEEVTASVEEQSAWLETLAHQSEELQVSAGGLSGSIQVFRL